MQVTKINTADINDWYQAIQRLKGGKVAIGYGTTPENAIADCLRQINRTDRKKISQLK